MHLTTPSRRSSWRAAAAGLAAALCIGLAGSVPAAGQQRPSQQEMAGLDFLLGDYACEYTDYTTEEPTTVTVYWETEKTLDDKFYEMTLSGSTPPFEGRWVFGWNAVDGEFLSFYWDTWGNTGSPTSAGWQDGVLTFSGEYVTAAGHRLSKDEFEVVSPTRFTDHAYIRASESEPWQQISYVDCRQG
jgi:hypothetical protein